MFIKQQLNSPDMLYFVKHKSYQLLSAFCGSPTLTSFGRQGRLNRMSRVFGGKFDLCQPLQIKPTVAN